MKILIISTNADLAGAPVHVRDLVLGLRKLGNAIEAVFGESGPIQQELAAAGITTNIIPTIRSSINPLNDYKAFRALRQLVGNNQPDLIHAHSSKAGMIARCVGASCQTPVVYTVHGWGFGAGRKATVSLFVYLIELLLAKFTSCYIFVSNADRAMGNKYLPIRSVQQQVVYNGTPFNKSQPIHRPSAMNVTMVARNDYQKDYQTFFKGLTLAPVDHVRVVGRGTDNAEFIELARTLAGDNFSKIEFMGARTDVAHILEDSSVFVLSSRYEGLPIVIIEAMAKGLPIVATAVGGIPELVQHGVNGYLFSSGNSNELAHYLNKLAVSVETRQAFGQASFERFSSEFTVDTLANKTQSIYSAVCNAVKRNDTNLFL